MAKKKRKKNNWAPKAEVPRGADRDSRERWESAPLLSLTFERAATLPALAPRAADRASPVAPPTPARPGVGRRTASRYLDQRRRRLTLCSRPGVGVEGRRLGGAAAEPSSTRRDLLSSLVQVAVAAWPHLQRPPRSQAVSRRASCPGGASGGAAGALVATARRSAGQQESRLASRA